MEILQTFILTKVCLLWQVGQRFPLIANLLNVISKSVMIWKRQKTLILLNPWLTLSREHNTIFTRQAEVWALAVLWYVHTHPYLQFGGSALDQVADHLLDPLRVLYVNRTLLKLWHLQQRETQREQETCLKMDQNRQNKLSTYCLLPSMSHVFQSFHLNFWMLLLFPTLYIDRGVRGQASKTWTSWSRQLASWAPSTHCLFLKLKRSNSCLDV